MISGFIPFSPRLRGLLCVGSNQMMWGCQNQGLLTFYAVIISVLPSSLTSKLGHHCVHMPVMQQGREKGEQTLPQEYDPESTHRNSTPTTAPESLTI